MKKYLFLLALIVPLLCASCNEWLDEKPETEEREKDLFKKYKGFKEALAGCYTSMSARNIYGDNLTMSKVECLARLWEEPLVEYLPAEHQFYHHDYQKDEAQRIISAIYMGLYNIVAQSNKVIEHIATDGKVIKDPHARNVIEGEALALRAYCHFDVLRLFGQMPQQAVRQVSLPYAEKADIKILPTYYNYADFRKKLEDDLNKAEALLKASDPIVNATLGNDDFFARRELRMNYWAVKALQARYYLYVGETEKAQAAAMEIINNEALKERVNLAGDNNIRLGWLALPEECLFLLSNPAMLNYSITVLGGDITGNFDDNTQLHITTQMLDQQLYAGKNTASDNRYLRVWERNTTNSRGKVCPTLKKYYYDRRTARDLNTLRTKLQIVPMLRISEIYLIAMETSRDLATINRLYKEYMASHNVNIASDFTSHDAVQQEVVNEYRREFYGEGQMFYVYKRLGMKDLLWKSEEMTENEYILPLPITEFDPK